MCTEIERVGDEGSRGKGRKGKRKKETQSSALRMIIYRSTVHPAQADVGVWRNDAVFFRKLDAATLRSSAEASKPSVGDEELELDDDDEYE